MSGTFGGYFARDTSRTIGLLTTGLLLRDQVGGFRRRRELAAAFWFTGWALAGLGGRNAQTLVPTTVCDRLGPRPPLAVYLCRLLD